jgi:hypothetical protein
MFVKNIYLAPGDQKIFELLEAYISICVQRVCGPGGCNRSGAGFRNKVFLYDAFSKCKFGYFCHP